MLAVLLQGSTENQQRFGALDGMEMLLTSVAQYKKRDIKGEDGATAFKLKERNKIVNEEQVDALMKSELVTKCGLSKRLKPIGPMALRNWCARIRSARTMPPTTRWGCSTRKCAGSIR